VRFQECKDVKPFTFNLPESINGGSQIQPCNKAEKAQVLNTVTLANDNSEKSVRIMLSDRSKNPLSEDYRFPTPQSNKASGSLRPASSLLLSGMNTTRMQNQKSFQNLDMQRYKTLKKKESKIVNSDIFDKLTTIFKNSET